MADEYNVVPVNVQNISDIKVPLEKTTLNSANIYNLLNGKDYKDSIKEVVKASGVANTRLESIRSLLSGVKTSVDKIVEKSNSTQSSSSSISNSSTQEENYRKDTKDSLNKIIESNQKILEEIRNLIKELPNIELHSTAELSESSSTAEVEEKRKDDKYKGDSLKNTQEMISLLRDIKNSQTQSKNNAQKALSRSTGGSRRGGNFGSDDDGFAIDKDPDAGRNKSQRYSYDNALSALRNQSSIQSKLLGELGDIGKQFFNVFKKSVSDIFNKWDNQTRQLKEMGMGSSNAVQLNRMTKRTMDATEDLLGYNVSVDKAIKATNDMLAAGMNPRYVRENNKQLITGLEAVGIQLAPSTIREIGNSVYDASTVKQLTGEWAALTSPDTENALDKGFVSRQLSSDQYKQMLATIMRTGEYSRSDVEKEMQAALRTMIEGGWDNESAWNVASFQTQARLGGGAFTVVPKEIQSLIGAAQMSGTYKGVSDLAESLKETTKLYHTDLETRRRINQASPSLALANDFTLFSNIQMNDAHTRRIASQADIQAGQYEGFIPRMGKALAGILPAESLSGASQSLTGESTFFTQMGGGILSKVGSFAGDAVQTGLLAKIAFNTSKGAEGTGSLLQGLFGTKTPSGSGAPATGALGKVGGLGGVTAILGGIALTSGMIYDAYDENTSAQDQSAELRNQINESVKMEEQLKAQLREARLSGDARKVEEAKRLLQEAQNKTDQQIDMLEQSTDREDISTARGWGAGIGAVLGGIIGTIIAPGLGTGIGIAAGAALGGGGSNLVAYGATSDTESQLVEKRTQARHLAKQGRLNEYASGGLITSEQYALVGEGNNPEVILPLSDYNRSMVLLRDASNRNDTDPRLSSLIKNISHYKNGGIVKEEELAIVGENDNPEVVIPLNNADKAKELMSQASSTPGVDSDVSDMMSKATENKAVVNLNQKTIADLIISNAKSVLGAPYIANSNYDANPQKGMVCNQLVEYSYHKAGIPLKSRSVHYHMTSGDWVLTDTPQPGFAIFSNYGYKDKYGLSDYGHLGIVGYGNERIHASSAQGRVVHDMDLTKTLSYEKNPKKYAKSYIFGYLKGVDYGNGTDLPEPAQIEQGENSEIAKYTSYNNAPVISNVVSDLDTEANIVDKPDPFVVSKRDVDFTNYKSFLDRYTPESEILNNEVVGDILLAKKSDISDSFYDMLASNNPFGVQNIDGTIAEYTSLQEGVNAFISKMETSYDNLQNMSYMQQLDYLRDMSIINAQDYSKTKAIYDERLYQAIDRLRQSIDQSNMYSRNASMRNLPTQPHADRRFV